jgi:glyoxylase-like metal-dependent hydrolase (beta-lactamase superfamily II)
MATNRREFLTTASLVLAGGAFGRVSLAASGQAQAPPPAPAFTDLRGNIGIFTARGGTIGWFVSPDGVVVIDSQYPDTAAACLEGINQRSSKRPVDVLFVTHHHGDHTAGLVTFKPVTKSIVAHVKEVEAQKAATKPGSEATVVYADRTFTETWTEKLGPETIEAVHLGPAHTGGDAIIFFQRANVVHVGDLVFNRIHPYIDKAAGASIAGWITLLERAVKGHSADTMFIFSHAKQDWKVTGASPSCSSCATPHGARGVRAGRSRPGSRATKS